MRRPKPVSVLLVISRRVGHLGMALTFAMPYGGKMVKV